MSDRSGAAIPRQSSVWDDRRNSSGTRPPSPNALRECLAAMAALRRSDPALCKWIADGYPRLTDAEHVARFGASYEPPRRRRAT